MGFKQTPIVEFAVATTSYQDLLEAQKDLFQSQVEKLQYIVATQCKLTGVNPLSQEMAAGALSIKIGKRPRDLMNLNAIKYMKSVFSTRDAISKKDSREISAHLGVTVTQVRDFFTGQRSRVRKFVRLSGKKAGRSAAHVAVHDGMELPLDPNMPAELVSLETMAPENVEEGRSCSTQHDVPTGMKKLDRHFVANIFGLMRREESFTGQVKLLKWILRIKNCSVLKWFVTRGGVLTLATWLSQAAMEEQTSLAYVILKVLSSLPVCEAIPVHISAMLLSVNRLRFYRRPGISSRARAQLCKWSNILNEMWNSRGLKSASYSQAEMLLKQSINEVMINSSWESKDGNTEALEFLSKNPDNHEKLDMSQPLKMLMASGSDSNKRRSVLPSQTRERRKVKMVEHPDQRLAVRSPLVAKSTPPPRCRPLSADDIQKAKMCAEFMQGRKGKKPIACSDDQLKPKSLNSCSYFEMTVLPSASVSYVRPELEEGTKLESVICRVASPQETHLDLDGHPWYRRLQIPWQTPQELKIMEIWRVGTGDDSKEVEAQRNRIRRESEVIYRGIHEIPSDPRDPWDREMDYDDALTLEIPMEQILDNEPLEALGTSSVSAYGSKENVAPVVSKSSVNMPEPDLELLAELLRNPELVFALTSGGAGDPLSDETVKLLDMIRRNSVTSLGGLGGKACNKVEVSLRSPTSSGNIANQQVPDFDFSRNRLLQQPALTKGRPYEATAVFHSVQPKEICPHITFINPQNWPTVISAPQPSATFNQSAHMAAPPVTSPQTSIQLPEQWRVPTNPPMHHQCTQPSSSDIHSFTPKIMLNDNSMGNVRTSPMCVEMPLRATQDLESIYYNQQSATLNNAYDGGPVHAAVLAGSWNGRNKLIQRAEFESWGRDSSTLRHNEYIPGKNFHGPRMNLRHGRAI